MKTINNLKAEQIRKSILQLAIQGKLVKQDPNDEPASELVKRIYEEKKKLISEGKIKKDKNESYIFKGDDNCYYEKIGKNEPVKLENLPFDIPDNWMWVRQKNICWLESGVKSNNEKLPYLEAKVIRGKQEPQIINSGVVVDSSDRVILVDGENSGEVMIPPMRGYMGSTFKILSCTSFFDFDFLLSLFSYNKDKYKNSKTGAAIPHLNKDIFKESFIAVPPFSEQKRIVDKINSIEPLIQEYDSYEQKLSSLEFNFPDKLKKSILQYAIEGKLVKQDPNDEPASVLLERIKAEKEKLIKEGKIKRDKNESYVYQGDDKNYYEKIGNNIKKIDIPFDRNDIAWTKLKNIAFITKLAGFEYSQYIQPNLVNSGIPLFKGKNVQNSQVIYQFENYIPLEISNKLSRSQINRKCLLTPYVGTIGNVGIHDKTGTFHLGSNVGKIEIYNYSSLNVMEEYVFYYLKSFTGYYELTKFKKATAQESISIDAIRETIIPIYPLSIQEKIHQKIILINQLI